jgi:hypothetical protein
MKTFLIALLLMTLCGPVHALSAIPIEDITVCTVPADHPPVSFTDPGCVKTTTAGLDPQGRDIWVKARVTVPQTVLAQGPLGLFISAKASSEAYVNGAQVGRNGVPGATRIAETPGQMDVSFYLPPGLVREGANDVVLRLSSFHGVLHLRQPVHWIVVAPYDDPLNLILRAYWPSLVTFGVLLAGGFFFASSAISGVNRRDALLLALLSALAAGQLFVEIFRGLVPYAYPVQDIRLIAITGFSTAFALTLIILTASRFRPPNPRIVEGSAVAVTLMPLLIFPGFDSKALYVLFAASVVCTLIAGYAAWKGDRSALLSAIVLAIFAAPMLLLQGAFLDAAFFYEVATVILILFIVRAVLFERDRRLHEQTRMRAHDLEMALVRVTQSPARIRVNSAGSVTFIDVRDIAFCKGADDYVELHLIGGRTVLHNGALADLEADLPVSFLRVHRSYIVNTSFVETLTREATGVGVLKLSNGATAPVSRRIMPKVRGALS